MGFHSLRVTIPDERGTQTHQENSYIQFLPPSDEGNRRSKRADVPIPFDYTYEFT